jgi:drug/metabolite transporter (DMT)-like permease
MLARGISMDKRAKTRTQPVLLALAFLAIYFVWGSTYLAIRYAVEGIPPLLVAGTRHLIAGTILCAWAWWRGERPAPAQWRAALVLGVLFFLVSHGALHWSERFVPSGLAAVLIAIEPVLIAVLQPTGQGKRRSGWTWVGFALGLAGVLLLMDSPAGAVRGPMLLGSLAVLISAFSWAVGVVYSRRSTSAGSPLLAAALPMLCGGLMLGAAAALHGDLDTVQLSLIPPRSLAALGYLTLFGSLVAYTAYMWLLDRYPPEFVATHTYVNPVIAILCRGRRTGASESDPRVRSHSCFNCSYPLGPEIGTGSFAG